MAERVVKKQLQAGMLKAGVANNGKVDMSVVVHQSIDSTNSWSLQQCRVGKRLPFVCFAEEQTQGRGRRGKYWHMPPYSNVAMSIVWPFALALQSLHLLPLCVALAIVETLEGFNLRQVQIKWPNDVYVRGKKIAGILIETQSLKNGPKAERHVAAVIGVGVNYDMSALHNSELPAFTDILDEIRAQAVGQQPERTIVAAALLRSIVDVCQNFQENSQQYLEKYRTQYDYCKAKDVEIILDNREVLSGIAQGVNEQAELVVMIDGEKRVFNSAEVSVRTAKGSVTA